MRYFRLFGTYFRVGVLNELQYRVNFFAQLFQSLLSLGTGLIGLALVFSYTDSLGGWGRAELLAVMGVHILMGGLINTIIQPNMERLIDDIHNGTLDFVLTKPEDSQVMVSVRETRIWQTVDVAMGLGVLGYAALQLRETIGMAEAAGFVAALLFGGVMVYCFWLMLTTGAFWIVRADNILEIFQSMYAAGRWPIGIYPDWLRTGLTFLVPIAFAVTVPAEAVIGRLTPQTLSGAAVFAVALLILSRQVWKWGLRHYTGASA
jgi:ABC-2 type transport system permease protein